MFGKKDKKLELLKDLLGTRAAYSEFVKNVDLSKEEKDILLRASVEVKKKSPNQNIIDLAHAILVQKSIASTSSNEVADDVKKKVEEDAPVIEEAIVDASKKALDESSKIANDVKKKIEEKTRKITSIKNNTGADRDVTQDDRTIGKTKKKGLFLRIKNMKISKIYIAFAVIPIIIFSYNRFFHYPSVVNKSDVRIKKGIAYYKSNIVSYTGIVGSVFHSLRITKQNGVLPRGRLHEAAEYVNGKKHGEYELWNVIGNIEERGTYEEGEKHGLYELWYENGSIKERAIYQKGGKHGIAEDYYDDGEIKRKIQYIYGKKEGEEISWISGETLIEQGMDREKDKYYAYEGINRYGKKYSGNFLVTKEFEIPLTHENRDVAIGMRWLLDTYTLHDYFQVVKEGTLLNEFSIREYVIKK